MTLNVRTTAGIGLIASINAMIDDETSVSIVQGQVRTAAGLKKFYELLNTVTNVSTANVSSTSYATVGDAIAINASPSGKLRLNLTGNYKPPNDGSSVVALITKIRIKPDGGAFSDVSGSEATGTQGRSVSIGDGGPPYKATSGSVNGSGPYVVSGLNPGGLYYVERQAKKSSGGDANTASCNLTLTAEWEL